MTGNPNSRLHRPSTTLLPVLLIVLAAFVFPSLAHAQATTPTVSTISITSSPGPDNTYANGDTITLSLTFSEAVTVTGTPQLTLDVGGRRRTAEYSEGSTTTQLLFTYTVHSGDEDTDGIAVVANSLSLNGGAIRAGSANAALGHAGLQSNDHKVDGIAPTVTVGGESRTYVPPGRQFNVVFYFSEKVYGITDAEITVTNGLADYVRATSGNATWPKYTRWDVIIVPAAEGPVSVTLEAGAATDASGNGNTAPDSPLEVIAGNPVTVEVARTNSGFAEGGKAEFTVTRSRDNGAIPVSLSVDQTGDLLSGAVEVYPPADPNNPYEPAPTQTHTFTETPFNLNLTFAAGETSKRIALPTEDDFRVEDDGTITLSVPAQPAQYKYIPGHASSATTDVRDNDEPVDVALHWQPALHPYNHLVNRLNTALEGGKIFLNLFGYAEGEPLSVILTVTAGANYLDLDGELARNYENLGNGKLRAILPLNRFFANLTIPVVDNSVRDADGFVTVIIEPDPSMSYIPNPDRRTVTIPVKDNDTPPSVFLSPSTGRNHTEGARVTYTLVRSWEPGQSYGALPIVVRMEQTGDYITWPAAHQPDADGLVTIPVTIPAGFLFAEFSLETVDDEVSELDGSLTATILADAGGSYVTGADSDHTTKLLDNDPPIISVAAVSAKVTEGTDAQFRFSRSGNTSVATRVGLWVGGLPKIMTDATDAIALTADNADLSQRLHIYGAWVDYILEFAAGETEKTLSLTTEADNVNEGDGLLGVTIVQRVGNPFGIGTGYAQVLVKDDDIPTVSLTQPVGPTGFTLSADGTTWEGQLGETDRFTLSSVCTGVTEFSPDRRTNLAPLALWVMYANHPAHYSEDRQNQLGANFANVRSVGGGDCAGTVQSVTAPWVGPENGLLEIELLAQSEFVPTGSPWNGLRPKVYDDFITQYEEAARAAAAAGTLITQKGIFSPARLTSNYRGFHCLETDFRYCPKYLVGTVNKIRLTVINRDPTILIKAENSQVEEGEPARFVVERLWNKALYANPAPVSTTVVSLRATQNGQYITGALPVEVTFGQNELRKVIELQTVDDGAFGPNGSLTIELLPDTTSGNVNLSGKYTTWTNWLGHTPDGGRSDRATVAIINNDDKPGISIAPTSALEGDSGSANMTFTVTLAEAVTDPVMVNYATSDGTAVAGQDYTAVSNGSVTIAAGNTTAEFTVPVAGDQIDELDETFTVTISLPVGANAAAITGGATAAAAGTILDDDPAVVTVAAKVDTVEEGEAAVFVLTRAGMTNGRLAMQVRLRSPGRLQMLDARFEPGAVTTEIAVATHNNNLVDYPSVRDYTIEVFGDGAPLGQDDRSFTPGAPATATVKVTDDDELINVTVYPVKAVISHGNPYWIFRRDGDISQPLSALFGYYLHKSDRSRTEIAYGATARFEAGQDEVVLTYHDYDFVEDIEYPAEDKGIFPITLTYTVFGDGGQYGLHRIYQGGNPNTATVTMEYNGYERRLVVGAEAPLWVSVGQTVNIPLMVTNVGSLDSGTPITITSTHYSEDRQVNGTNEPRMTCQFDGPIAAGESAGCEVSFLVLEKDLNWRNGAEIELDVVASDGRTTSNAFRIFMRVRNGVSVGFKETANLPVTEPGFGEANARANLTVTRVGQSGEEVQVAYTLEPWPTGFRSYSPVEGVDYADNSDTPGVITFGENETEKTITIDILWDQIDEAKEQFLVTLVPPEGVLVEEDKRTRIVVINDTNPPPGESYRPTASLQLVSSGPVPESEGPVEFAIVLDREWGIDALYEVELTFDQLTATPGIAGLGKKGDFEDPGVLVVRIPAGQTRFEFSIPLYDDDVREEDETFKLLLGSSIDKSFRTIGPSNTALATIADDDRIPPTEVALSLSHNGSALQSVPEGSTQQDITVTASFPQIRWPGDASNAPLRPADPRDVDTTVRVRFDPNSGATHAAGLDDFAPLKVEDDQGAFQEVESIDIVIPAGQTSGTATLRFSPVKDDIDEEDESVSLVGRELVASDSSNSLPVRSASFTIIDDDTRGITLSPAKLAAGTGISMKEGGTSTYSLVLDSEPTDTVTVTVAGRQGDLISLTPETLTFTPSDWSTAKTISVVSLDDGTDTSFTNAVISHQVSGGDYGSVTVREIWVQIENTTQAYIYLDDAQASESDGHLEFTVSVRPILRTVPVVVRYATVDGTAVAGTDYTREVTTDQTYNVFSIPANRDTGIIRIPITDNQVYGPAKKTFTLQLTNQNNKANLEGDATSLTATGSILDDDPKPVVGVAGPDGAVSYVSENAKDPVTFTLTLVGQSAEDVTVDYATGEAGLLALLTARQGPAGATEGEDYAGTSGTVTFTSGQTTKTVTVQVTNDDVSEETEFFGFRISAPQGADLTGQRSEDVADVGLLDDDRRAVTIHPTSIGLDEPASGATAVAGSYTVNLNSKPTDTITVTIGGGAPAVSLSGNTLTNNQLTFTTTNWNTAQTITVTPVKDDNAVGETVTLTHTLSGGDYAGIAADSVTINLTDSDTRIVVLSRQSLTVPEGDPEGVPAGSTYTVRLATQPTASVSVSITGQAGTDLTLDKTTLTFTVDNWNTAQTVTVEATHDDDGSADTATLTHTASGGDYANVTKDLPVTVTDDDTAGLTIEPTTLSVVAGGSNEYNVRLATEPTGDVTVTISGHASTAVTLDKTTLTFTVGNWSMAQTITVSAAQSASTGKVTLTHAVSGADYGSVTADSVVVSVVAVAAQQPTLQVGVSSSTQTLIVPEGGANSYTLLLSSRPTADVTVDVTLPADTDLTLDKTTLTFTATNWDTPQTVTVTAAEDDDGVTDAVATLTHTISGGGYGSTTVPDLEVSITENDSAGVTIEPAALSVVAGRSNEYTVALATEPTGDVTVTVSGHASTDLTLDKTTLTFTASNWDSAQTVTVSATQNAATATVPLAHAVTGADYGSVTAESVAVSVVAAPTQQLTLQIGVSSSTQTLIVPEGGANSYTLLLSSRPSADVAIGVTLPAGTDLTLDKTSLTFTVDNWDDAQTVTVTAAEDDDGVTDAVATLTHTISGGGYGSTTVPDLEVSITENDTAGLVISKDNLTVGEGDAAGTSYTVALATEPSSSVSVSITGHAGTDLTLDKTTLTFAEDDWATAQTVTVNAGHDDDGSADTATLTHTASGGDYANVTKDLTVTVTDDDSANIVLSEPGLTLTEGDAAGTSYTVALATKPSGEVTVTISGQASTDLSLSGATLISDTLTFTVNDWNVPQTVTVKAAHDDDGSADTATLTHTASGADYANVTEDLTVTVTDNDTPAVTIEPTALSVVTGRSNEYNVRLATEPTGDVTVTVSGHASTAVTLDKTTLTFTVGNWSMAQTITVSAAQSSATGKVTLAHAVTGADYGSVTADSVVVSVVAVAGQQPTLQVGVSSSTQTLTVPEGGSNSYALVLSSRPTGDVAIGVTLPAGTDLTLSSDMLTFTVDNWDVAQTVTVTAAEDDDGVTDAVATLTHTISGGGYGSTTVPDLEVSTTENDTAGLVISKDNLTVGEGDAAGSSYTVALATKPSGSVTVSITGHAGTDLSLLGATLSSDTLTFTVDDWATAQTVTVKAGHDDDGSADTATLTHTASGGDYANVTKDLTVTVTDDDSANIVLSEPGLTLTEGDAAGTSYTVALATKPSGEVTVTISGQASTDLSLSGATLISDTLTFTVNDWNVPQTVTVKAAHDDDGSADTATLTHTASGADYANVTEDLTVTVTDNDTPAVTIEPTALSVVTGRTNKYSVKLATEPTGDVTVTISGHASTAVTPDNTTLTFTVGNWSMAQTITVSAAENAATGKVTLTHAVAGADYGSVTADSVVVSVVAVAGQQSTLQVGVSSSTQTLIVPEGGANSYTLLLSSRPSADVTVDVTLPADTDLTLDKTTLTFTATNWDTPQTVTVTAAEDDDGVTDAGVTLTHTVSAGGFGSTSVPDLEVSITENDTAGVTIEPAALSVVAGRSNEYTVALATEPTGNVTVTISGHASTAVTLDKTTLTFTVGNWSMAQTITVSAAQSASTGKVTLTHAVSGADYGSVTADSVVVSVVAVAAQQPTLQVGVSSSTQTLTVPEGGSNSYALVLSSRPTGDVAIGVTLPAGTDLTLDKTRLTFTVGNWDTAQTVTVTAAEDDDGVTDAGVTLTHTISGGGYGSTTVPDLEVSITENDTAGVTIEPAALSVVAGRSNEYTVALATEPTGDVTVTVSGHASTAVTLDKTTLTFTASNWDSAQTVTVSATQNATTATVPLAHAVTGADYGSVTAESVAVSVVAAPTQQLTLQIGVSSSTQTLIVPEGGANSYTLLLSSRPSADVTVDVTLPADTDLTLDKTTLTFTATNWDTPQTVTVTAAEDDDGVTDAGVTLTHTVSAGGFGSTTVPDVVVRITENDAAGLIISSDSLTVTEGVPAGSSYTVSLATQPTGSVSVSITGQAGTDLTLDKTTLTFTSNNWNAAQTVTVTARQDHDATDDRATLTHTAAGADYANLTAALPVTVSDDDTAVTVQFGADAYTVSEGSTATIAVTLSADPQSMVVIPLVTTDHGGAVSDDYSVPSSVMFNTGEMSKTFEFRAMADDAADAGESVMIGFGTSLPSRVTEGTPKAAMVTINQVFRQFSLDCSLTATVWCADLRFSDRVAENYGWLYMRYGHGWDPPSSLSDDDFRFRGVDYDVRSMELRPGTHPVMPNAWSRWQQGYSSFRIGIYWDYRWGAPSEEHYRDWVLQLDGLELPFKDALRHGGDFVWVGEEFQQVFNDWTPSTVTKIGIKEVAAADQDTNPLLPWTPMQVDAWPEGPDRLLVVWAKPAWFYPGLPDPTSYIVQWKLASADWSDSAAVSQLEVAATSNFQAVIVNGMTEDAVYSVRVIASNDAGDGPPSEETLGRPQDSLPRLIARTVNGQTLTLRFSEQLDPNAVPTGTAFTVLADGGLIEVDSVAIRGNEVVLTLDRAVTAAAHSVKVRYDKPTDPSAVFLQDTNGNYANIRQHHELLQVVNITPQSSVQPLTAQFTNMPSSHDGRTRFTFDIEFSEPVWIGDGLARDDMLGITGGTVISAPWKDRRTDQFIVHVQPDTQGDIVIVLPGHRACHGIVGSYREGPDPVAGAPCAVGSRVLTNEPTVTIPGPSSPAQQLVENTPAEGEPQINGIPELGQTLSADTTAISDADGIANAVFQYQWLAEDADIAGATGATYTVVTGDVGKAIKVRVAFTDDRGNEETLTSVPTDVVTATGLQLQSATVDGGSLTLTYNETLDTGVRLGTAPFAVNVNGSSRRLIAVGLGESNVLLLLSSAVEAGDTVTVDYTAPDGPDFIRDTRGRKAASFSGQAVMNDTPAAPDERASDPLTASVRNVPSSHDGNATFTFELRFSEDPKPDFSYVTVRDHAFTVTGGSVTYVRRLEPGKNVRWEITVAPGSSADVAIALNATTDCSAQGPICTEDGGKLSGGLLLAVPGPNIPATGLPTITGTAQVGETLNAGAAGISDDDGLANSAFAYQWLADDIEINRATTSTYTLVTADAGKAIRVRVSLTDDAGNDEQLTSSVTRAVAAAPPAPNTPATGLPTITGTAQVGEILNVGAAGISDGDGLSNATFAYQWLADEAEINGATASTYTLVAADAGKAIKLRVSFTDDAGNDEQLTSAATGAVAAAVVQAPLTATIHGEPSSHNGQDAFTFELRFSGDPKPDFSYVTVRDHAFTVTGGSVTYVRRLQPGKNIRWEITVTPDPSADVAIALNATTDCSAQGAICTEDARKLSGPLQFTVTGPGQ